MSLEVKRIINGQKMSDPAYEIEVNDGKTNVYQVINGERRLDTSFEIQGSGSGGGDCPKLVAFVNDNGDGSIESYDDGRVYARMDNLWGIDEKGEYVEMNARVDLMVTNSGLPSGGSMKWKNGMRMQGWKGEVINEVIDNSNFSEMTTFESCFENTRDITEIHFLDTSNGTNMEKMFHNSFVSYIPNINTSNVTNMNYMFALCSFLQSIPSLDCSKVTSAVNMFGYTFSPLESLTDIGGLVEMSVDLDLSPCTALTEDALMNVINNLATVSGKTLTLGSTNLAKLTDEQKQVAIDKGWTLA